MEGGQGTRRKSLKKRGEGGPFYHPPTPPRRARRNYVHRGQKWILKNLIVCPLFNELLYFSPLNCLTYLNPLLVVWTQTGFLAKRIEQSYIVSLKTLEYRIYMYNVQHNGLIELCVNNIFVFYKITIFNRFQQVK